MHQDVGDIAKQPSRLDRCISMLLSLVQPQSDASPKFAKQDPIPILTHWSCNIFVLTHAMWPVVVRMTYEWVHDGENLPFMATVLLYLTAHIYMTVREATVLLHMGAKIGFLDGDKHARDRITTRNLLKTIVSVTFFSLSRPALVILVSGHLDNWDFSSISWHWLPVELLLYPIILDFWFYTYHRACHEISFLWKYHRTHHLTKHPIPVLSSFSDPEQEIVEAIVVPLLSFLTVRFGFGLPMYFHDWWVCQAYILFAEIMGHSGLRVYAITPGLASFVLQFVGCELIIEDHDLHHRQGWRKSGNYGKQTKLWDRLFRTASPRIESENVDFDRKMHMPFF